MKHQSSRRLFDYWNRRRGNRPAPERGEIEPGAIRTILSDTFILGCEPGGDPAFRLAGTKVCALFCRELKGQSFTALWESAGREKLRKLVQTVADESVGLVAGVRGEANGGTSVELELLLLPLAYRGRAHARLLGVLAPIATPCWFGTAPLADLRLGSLRHLGSEVDIATAPRFVSGRPRPGLVVYEGGRQAARPTTS